MFGALAGISVSFTIRLSIAPIHEVRTWSCGYVIIAIHVGGALLSLLQARLWLPPGMRFNELCVILVIVALLWFLLFVPAIRLDRNPRMPFSSRRERNDSSPLLSTKSSH